MAADDRSDQGALLEDNKARVRRDVEAFQSARQRRNGRCAGRGRHHPPPRPGMDTCRYQWPRGRQGVHHHAPRCLPDLRAVLHDQLGDDDKVMDPQDLPRHPPRHLLGHPPTGKQVTIDLIDILRITDGQMVEHWNLVDWMGLMQQLEGDAPTRTTSE